MEFKVFAKKLKNVIGGKSNTKIFTKTLFETMMNESGPELLKALASIHSKHTSMDIQVFQELLLLY